MEDSDSKYGIFLNDDRIRKRAMPKHQPAQLNIGDIVQFGRLKNIWRLERVPIKICTSTIPREQIATMRQFIAQLNGEIVDVWSETCTHLTMNTVTVTMKVLMSLTNGIPIVTPDFWKHYFSAASENAAQLPNAEDFVPPIEEPFILKQKSMLYINLSRQRLFQGKTFAFMVSRHLRQFEAIINLAGGQCVSLDESRVRRSSLLKTDFIPVQYTPSLESQSTDSITKVTDYITQHNRRLIHESEIGFALIHSSTERFCNPDHRVGKDFEMSSMPMSVAGNVLAEETPSASAAVAGPSRITPVKAVHKLPETMDLTAEENNNEMETNVDKLKPASSEETTKAQKEESSSKKTRIEAKVQEVNVEGARRSGRNELKRKLPEPIEMSSKFQRRNAANVAEAVVNEEQNENVSLPAQSASSQDIPSQDIPPQVSPVPPRSQRPSNFLSTQKLYKHTEPVVANKSQNEPNEPEPMPAGMRKKRALELLKDDNDDDNEDLFQFSKIPSKKSKQTNSSGRSRTRLGDDDDNDEDLFNFSNVPSTSKSKQPAKTQSQVENREDITDSIARIQTEIETRLNVTDVQPVKRSQNGWLKRQVKNEANEVDSNANRSQVESSSVVIKNEPDDSELTIDEKKQKWIKSLKNVFEEKTVPITITPRSIDEPDRTMNSTTSVKNFKAFVKVNGLFRLLQVLWNNDIHLNFYRNAILRLK